VAGATATLISHRERFPVVGSTNDVVAGWLADGVPEVCLAVADEQASGRGRQGRSWQAPPGAALLVSLGFRPTWLEPAFAWRIAAIVSLSMAEAAERIAGLEPNTIRLKWPNDLVAIDDTTGGPLKLAGVLGETTGLGTVDPRVIVGIGTNVDWARADFPPQIADGMTSLRELAGGSIDRDELHQRFLDLLEPAVTGLRRGAFDAGSWQRRQLTNDRPVRLQLADGSTQAVHARRVDPDTGGLIVASNGVERTIMSGEIHHLRLAGTGPHRAHVGAGV
jgi:BirA family transcriptional regulator, biotin operon repressor / biotin---[acetyl-CoA-carboxylase] ligase